MFGAVHRSGQEYQVRVIENTVMTGTKGREGGVFYHNINHYDAKHAVWNTLYGTLPSSVKVLSQYSP